MMIASPDTAFVVSKYVFILKDGKTGASQVMSRRPIMPNTSAMAKGLTPHGVPPGDISYRMTENMTSTTC